MRSWCDLDLLTSKSIQFIANLVKFPRVVIKI